MASGAETKSMAKALFEMALKQNDLVNWLKELRLVSDMVKDPSVSVLLQNDRLSFTEKTKVLNDRTGVLNNQILNLISLLLSKGKLFELDDITTEYQRLLDTYHGVEGAEVAEVTTAIPLDDEYKLSLGKRLTEIIGKPIVVKATVDPSLIGGIIVRVGDKLIDGSIRYKLATLNKELVL
jgi:F-type H+-transporting ATPase subunit delta